MTFPNSLVRILVSVYPFRMVAGWVRLVLSLGFRLVLAVSTRHLFFCGYCTDSCSGFDP